MALIVMPAPIKPINDIDNLPLKQQCLKVLTDYGLTTAEAGKALEYKGKSAYEMKSRLNKYNLSNRKLGSLAFKAVKETLKMQSVKTNEIKPCPACKNDNEKKTDCKACNSTGYVQTEIFPSHGNRLDAAKMYYERTDPVVNINKNLNVNVDIDPVDLKKYE